jgi:hypothetical protein
MKGKPGHPAVPLAAAAFFFAVCICVQSRVLSFWVLEVRIGRNEVERWAGPVCFLIGMFWAFVGLYWPRKRKRKAQAASSEGNQ